MATDTTKTKGEKKTDLERFVELYKSFGIECKVDDDGDGNQYVCLAEDQAPPNAYDVTISEKLEGWEGFHSIIKFDQHGNFISQGFWE